MMKSADRKEWNGWRIVVAALLIQAFAACPVLANEPGPTAPAAGTPEESQRLREAEHMERHYRSNQVTGIVLAGAVAPLFAGLTVLGSVLIYRHGVEDDGGFCNNVYYDDFHDEYDTNCKGDRGEVAGIVLVATFGTAATLSVLIPGIVTAVRYGSLLRLHRYRMRQTAARSAPWRLEPMVGPRSAGLRVRF